MRTICLAFIPIIGAVIGYLISFRYLYAREFWDGFYNLNKKLKSEIRFTQNTLPNMIKTENAKNAFIKALNEDLFDADLNAQKVKLYYLSEKEKEFYVNYVKTIGSTDKDAEIAFIDSVEQELYTYFRTHEEKYKKYRPLFIKLGFLFGLIMFILLV